MSEFIHRGVIEGYYGPPYAHADRLWLVERLGRWGMNRFVYAPKDDPLHRAEWRTPYPGETMEEFAELVACGSKAGVDVGFALSPGLSIEYGSSADREALAGKLLAFRELGARFFGLALDDVPTALAHDGDRRAFRSLAHAHTELAHDLLRALGPDITLVLVPTDYMGTEPTAYLEELGGSLDPAIEVAWTGRTVVSPTIPRAEAERRAATLRRRLLLWDNVPVADGPMRPMLHLGPYRGRDAGLTAFASGALLNPMQHPRASALALRTAADFLRDPERYDPEVSWRNAARELGDGAPEAFTRFAAAHRFSCLSPDDRDAELEAAIREVREGHAPAQTLKTLLEDRLAAADALRRELADRALAAEIEPWIESHHRESRRMAAAAELLAVLEGDANRMAKGIAFLTMEGRLTRIAPSTCASYGPRRVVYPQFACLHDDAAAFGGDPVLFRDRCLGDELVAFAEKRALEALRA
ncbi:MAG: protein O-GlcNAcase [Proteobacteria bacterium]|nr:protein O-GlcNAcase [Pseudomonadota bacterium]